jgi:hypothetical protein
LGPVPIEFAARQAERAQRNGVVRCELTRELGEQNVALFERWRQLTALARTVLDVSDTASYDTGTLNSWSLSATTR